MNWLQSRGILSKELIEEASESLLRTATIQGAVRSEYEASEVLSRV